MTWFDYLVVAFVGTLVVRASIRGLIKEVFSLAGLVLGVIVATSYSEKLGEILNADYRQIDPFGGPAAYLLLFVGIGLIAWLLAMVTTKAVHGVGLSVPNRIGGGLFGASKGILFISVAVLILDGLGQTEGSWYQHAVTRPVVEPVVVLLRERVPQQWSDRTALGTQAERLKERALEAAEDAADSGRDMAQQIGKQGDLMGEDAAGWKSKASQWLDHFMESLFGKQEQAPPKEEEENVDPIGDLIEQNR
ncbi:MAG: hypothetical protein COX57_05470 [Alphaproteobacteria bacterium CG_4_10_14_0_2_um_filter_63_37]|nr:MAG: hypothetical protein AUJ55_12390 [Proteobacteria bacterium CG1_02_64_396]PJA25012.1 MAG: hypothetical protein COX57_05470 [Alphaproteobacteria bacterium CG_4_10_14_0_2_um_filter_63_37]